MPSPETLVATIVAIGALAAIAIGVLSFAQISGAWSVLTAILRGVVQLAAISVLLSGLLTHPALIVCVLTVMLVVATFVSVGRVSRDARTTAWLGGAIMAGAVVACAVVFATGALELSARYLLALGAILIGNAMSIATLTGRTLLRTASEHWDQVEGWLALGARPREATVHFARTAVREALVPSLDQTRTTGLVVLPGAFVGAIFGGLSPVEAGRFQIIVLAAILAAGAITAVISAWGVSALKHKPTIAA